MQSVCLQMFCSLGVVLLGIRVLVLVAVEFDHQMGLRTVKIHNVIADGALPVELYRITSQKIVPEMLLLTGHVSAKLPGSGFVHTVLYAVKE